MAFNAEIKRVMPTVIAQNIKGVSGMSVPKILFIIIKLPGGKKISFDINYRNNNVGYMLKHGGITQEILVAGLMDREGDVNYSKVKYE